MLSGTRIPPLRRQKSPLTPPQQALYRALVRAVGPQTLVILTRVNLGHVVQRPSDDAKYRAYWHHVCRQRIDFVLCSPSDFTPVLAIKLETRSVRRQRLERERAHANVRDIADEVLTRAKIPLLRLMAVDNYDFAPVMKEIRRLLLGVLATDKNYNVTPPQDTEEIYIRGLDGDLNESRDNPPPPTTIPRPGR